MQMKTTRRHALRAFAAAALVPAASVAAMPAEPAADPFIIALASLREACDARDAEYAKTKFVETEGEYDEDLWEELHARTWDFFYELMETNPTTAEGHAARLLFLAEEHPCHPVGIVCQDRDNDGQDAEYIVELTQAALTSTAALLRKLGRTDADRPF